MSVENVLSDPYPRMREAIKKASSSAKGDRVAHAGPGAGRLREEATSAPARHRGSPLLWLDGLPGEISALAPGMLYALMIDTQSIRLGIAAQSLSASAHLENPPVLVTSHDPQALVKKAKTVAPRLEGQLAAGSARILRLEADINRKLLRSGSSKLIDDLRAQGIAPYSLVIFDQATKLLGLTDPSTALATSQLFQAWAESAKLTILFLLETDKENPREYATLKMAAEHWAGLGVVQSGSSKTTISFKHWFGSRGITPGCRFTMGVAAQGLLGVTMRQSRANGQTFGTEPATITPSMDDQGLIATTAAVAGLGDFGERLQSCDDPLDLMDFARRSRGGTVLLHFSHRSELSRLSKLVASLRSITAPEVRIIVREVDAKLRQTENYALLQLGASFVVPKDIPPESARVLIEQLGSTALRRIHNPRAAEQLRKLLSDSSGLLLTPYDFKLRVGHLLDLSEATLLHTLVIFERSGPRPG